MSRSAYAFAILPLFVFGVSVAISNPPVRMAILDTPLDYGHPEIQAVLDEDLLRNVKLTDEKGEEKTWYVLNQEAKAEFERRLNKNEYKEQVEFFDALNMMSGKPNKDEPLKALQILGRVAKGMFRYTYSREYRSQINLLGGYLHGTHVAGLAVSSLRDVRLINYPITGTKKQLKLSEILAFDPEKVREEARRYHRHLSQVFKENNVRIVNLSIEFTPDSQIPSLKKRAGFFARLALNTVYRSQLLNVARTSSKIMIEELAFMARENPQAVFVFGAGNSKRNLDQGEAHTAQINEPNVIQVASITHEGKRSPFSNWSGSQIEVAAMGGGVLSALVGGGKVHMTGTSMSTPKVSNAIAKVFEENPLLSAPDAIQTFYDKYTVLDEKLADTTIGGRKLIEEGPSAVLKTLEEEVNLSSIDEGKINALIGAVVSKFSDEVGKVILTVKSDGKKHSRITFVKSEGKYHVNIEDISETSCEAAAG